MSGPSCPACGGLKFGDYNGRANAVCVSCGSLERGRYLWLVLRKLGLPSPGSRIMHLAPERFILDRMTGNKSVTYHAFDKVPEIYNTKKDIVRYFDICDDLRNEESNSYDLIIHNHVLEHIKCDPLKALKEFKRLLKRDGHLIFSVPFRGDLTDEDLSDDLSDNERKARFGQSDHMRIFGRKDFPAAVTKALGRECRVEPKDLFSDIELLSSMIPVMPRGLINGNTIFVYQKRGKV